MPHSISIVSSSTEAKVRRRFNKDEETVSPKGVKALTNPASLKRIQPKSRTRECSVKNQKTNSRLMNTIQSEVAAAAKPKAAATSKRQR